jgi:hypothetical protein
MIFRSRNRGGNAAAVADPPAGEPDARSVEEIFEEIEALEHANRGKRSRDTERLLIRLRHRAGAKLIAESGPRPEQPEPANDALPTVPPGSLPDISPAELTPELLRAGMLRDGCVIVRGVVDRDEARTMADDIDRAFEERAKIYDGRSVRRPYYEEFEPDAPYGLAERQWIRDTGGVLAADCPKLIFDLIEVLDRTGLRRIVTDYLGERPALSMNKSTLRRAKPHEGGAWHQDGAFMGDVRALNVWLSLSHCGDDAPGLNIVPRRLDHIVPTGTEGAVFDWSVSPQVADEVAGEAGPVQPIFEPGDVVLFDELCLHTTGLDPRMTKTRFAIETWFFGPSAFPADYVPLAF